MAISVEGLRIHNPELPKSLQDLNFEGLSKERKAIALQLAEKTWFGNSSQKVRQELLHLPDSQKKQDSFNGFLEDLAKRPEEIGGVDIIKLEEIPHGNFMAVPRFTVRKKTEGGSTGKEFSYEYVSWRHGPETGSKGLVLVERDGKISHFVVLKAEKFAPGKPVWDSLGGFAELSEEKVGDFIKSFKREIQEETGVIDLQFKEVEPLGKLQIDAGMTNNFPSLFYAVVTGDEAQKITKQHVNIDTYELQSGAAVLPIELLPQIVEENDDSFFLATVARLAAKGVIDLKPKGHERLKQLPTERPQRRMAA